MAKPKLATLLTDFGLRDPYVAAMKGVLLQVCPTAVITDLSHDVPPHDVLVAAYVLAHSAVHFPPQTVHVIVVDPGVGTDRPILVARLGGCPRHRGRLCRQGLVGESLLRHLHRR